MALPSSTSPTTWAWRQVARQPERREHEPGGAHHARRRLGAVAVRVVAVVGEVVGVVDDRNHDRSPEHDGQDPAGRLKLRVRADSIPGVRAVSATRYVTPLREGGSLPGLVEADDDGLYVVKFRGADKGPGALVAEVVAGELARSLGLPVPELVLMELDPQIGVAEPDPEIQDLLMASAGLNLGV